MRSWSARNAQWNKEQHCAILDKDNASVACDRIACTNSVGKSFKPDSTASKKVSSDSESVSYCAASAIVELVCGERERNARPLP